MKTNKLTKLDDLLQKHLQIPGRRPVIADRHTQTMLAGDCRVRNGSDACFLQAQHDLDVQISQRGLRHPARIVAEADDINGRRHNEVELRGLFYASRQICRLRDVLIDKTAEFFTAVLLQCQPDLQGAEAAGGL